MGCVRPGPERAFPLGVIDPLDHADRLVVHGDTLDDEAASAIGAAADDGELALEALRAGP